MTYASNKYLVKVASNFFFTNMNAIKTPLHTFKLKSQYLPFGGGSFYALRVVPDVNVSDK